MKSEMNPKIQQWQYHDADADFLYLFSSSFSSQFSPNSIWGRRYGWAASLRLLTHIVEEFICRRRHRQSQRVRSVETWNSCWNRLWNGSRSLSWSYSRRWKVIVISFPGFRETFRHRRLGLPPTPPSRPVCRCRGRNVRSCTRVGVGGGHARSLSGQWLVGGCFRGLSVAVCLCLFHLRLTHRDTRKYVHCIFSVYIFFQQSNLLSAVHFVPSNIFQREDIETIIKTNYRNRTIVIVFN